MRRSLTKLTALCLSLCLARARREKNTRHTVDHLEWLTVHTPYFTNTLHSTLSLLWDCFIETVCASHWVTSRLLPPLVFVTSEEDENDKLVKSCGRVKVISHTSNKYKLIIHPTHTPCILLDTIVWYCFPFFVQFDTSRVKCATVWLISNQLDYTWLSWLSSSKCTNVIYTRVIYNCVCTERADVCVHRALMTIKWLYHLSYDDCFPLVRCKMNSFYALREWRGRERREMTALSLVVSIGGTFYCFISLCDRNRKVLLFSYPRVFLFASCDLCNCFYFVQVYLLCCEGRAVTLHRFNSPSLSTVAFASLPLPPRPLVLFLIPACKFSKTNALCISLCAICVKAEKVLSMNDGNCTLCLCCFMITCLSASFDGQRWLEVLCKVSVWVQCTVYSVQCRMYCVHACTAVELTGEVTSKREREESAINGSAKERASETHELYLELWQKSPFTTIRHVMSIAIS